MEWNRKYLKHSGAGILANLSQMDHGNLWSQPKHKAMLEDILASSGAWNWEGSLWLQLFCYTFSMLGTEFYMTATI